MVIRDGDQADLLINCCVTGEPSDLDCVMVVFSCWGNCAGTRCLNFFQLPSLKRYAGKLYDDLLGRFCPCWPLYGK